MIKWMRGWAIGSLVIVFSFPASSFAKSDHELGPFPVAPTQVDSISFPFQIRLEHATQASALAEASQNKKIKILNQLQTDEREIPPGTWLSPLSVPEDDLLLPKGIMVSYPSEVGGALSFGRYAYLGDVPRFQPDELEMIASKMGHTLRVKAWVTEQRMAQYEFHLLNRFYGFYSAFMHSSMHMLPFQSFERLAKRATDSDFKKWLTVASYYSRHVLENTGFDIYAQNHSEIDQKNGVLLSMLRFFLNDPKMTMESGLALYQQYKTNSDFAQSRAAVSHSLFQAHFAERFVKLPPTLQKDGRIGYLNFVYPLAIDVEGPFHKPDSGLIAFPAESAPADHSVVNGRWWSNRWQDEFGGFPFLPITEDGVAFHGPISLFRSNDSSGGGPSIWFLRRENVSHSCLRMDPSDILELRSLLPGNLSELESLHQTISLQILEWPDVADLKSDGNLAVVDVAYYPFPSNGGDIGDPEQYRPEVTNQKFWKRFMGAYTSLLPGEKPLKLARLEVKDLKSGVSHWVNEGYLSALPRYEVKNGELRESGHYGDEVPVVSMPMRSTAILQYREEGVKYQHHDADGIDDEGVYPPSYFTRFY